MIESPGADIRTQDLYPALSKWAEGNSLKSILDIGCGQGVCSQHLGSQLEKYVGVDPSPRMIEKAQLNFPHSYCEFVVGNAYSLPLNDHSFDGAFAIALWHLLENKLSASKELARVLKPNGSFLVATANPQHYEKWLENYDSLKRDGFRMEGVMTDDRGIEHTDVLHFNPLEEILADFDKAGLRVDETFSFRTVIVFTGRRN